MGIALRFPNAGLRDAPIAATHVNLSRRVLGRRHERRDDSQHDQDNAAGETSNRLENTARSCNITKFSTKAPKHRIRKESQHNKDDPKPQDLRACRTGSRVYELRQESQEE